VAICILLVCFQNSSVFSFKKDAISIGAKVSGLVRYFYEGSSGIMIDYYDFSKISYSIYLLGIVTKALKLIR